MATAAGAQPGGTAARQRGGGGMRASFTDGGGDTNGFATKKLVARLSRNEGRQEPGTVPFGHFAGDVGQVWPKGEGGEGPIPEATTSSRNLWREAGIGLLPRDADGLKNLLLARCK